jgi:hypothetical protein
MAVAAPFSAVGGSTVRQSVRESERLEPSDFRVCSRTGNVLQSEHQQSGTRGLLSWQDERALLQQYSTYHCLLSIGLVRVRSICSRTVTSR